MATILGTVRADHLLGTGAADTMFGLGGDDLIRGLLGGDRLFGGNGDDTLDGGAGRDVMNGGAGFDLVLYSSNATPVWADLRSGVVTFPGQSWPAERLVDIEAIDGGSGGDTFIGNSAANLFSGNAGNDTLLGNVGADTLIGGAGADSLDGGNGHDRLVGGFGNDSLLGGLGNDTMLGGAGDDTFSIGPIIRQDDPTTLTFVEFGADIIDGGIGIDTLRIDGPTFWVEDSDDGSHWGAYTEAPPVRANLNLGTLRIGDSDNRSTLISIENIETGSGDDSINGSTGDNAISVGAGANVVYAGGGNDTIYGGSMIYIPNNDWWGSDSSIEILNGGAGDDVIYGNGASIAESYGPGEDVWTSTDILVGGDGNDTIYGGAAYQTITGGEGRDLFVLSDEPSWDDYAGNGSTYYAGTTITDFSQEEDTIRFDFTETSARDDFTGIAFAGEVESEEDLAIFSVGYLRTDEGTTLLAHLEEGLMHIFLPGYSGTLTAEDLGLGEA